MSTRILYISYTGLLDPLGQSQVLQYVLSLAREHYMTLLTFEKSEALADSVRVAQIRAECESAGVRWHYLRYHNRPNILATLYDLSCGIVTSLRLARETDTQVVHCRSYIAGLMGLAIKRCTGAKYIFDMRGFWPDERVDGGNWRMTSPQYRVWKSLERRLFLGADHVVSLTRAGVREFERFDYLRGRLPPVTVIPTCTNLDLFRPPATARRKDEGFTLGYIGSVSSWYMFKEVALVVRMLFDEQPSARFKIINKGGHDVIRQVLGQAGVDLSRVDLQVSNYDRVGVEVGSMDAGIFFIKPVWSKRASCPTRMGEFLACGKPCFANNGVGDVEEDFAQTGTGVTVSDWSDDTLRKALSILLDLSRQSDIAVRCRQAAEERFSLESGVCSYSAIYRRLCGQGAT